MLKKLCLHRLRITSCGLMQNSNILVNKMKLSSKNGVQIKNEPMEHPVLNLRDINPNVFDVSYAVRGPILARANEIQKELEKVIFIVFHNI